MAFASAAAENLEIDPHGSLSIKQDTTVPHKRVTPCALPNPSASTPLEIRFFDVAKPSTRPMESKTGPPEFPGFIAAVIVKVPELVFIEEIIPVVKIPACPRGEPMTPTHQPCLGEDPIHSKPGITVLLTIPATSLLSFQEIMRPSVIDPSDKTSETFLVPRQSSITW